MDKKRLEPLVYCKQEIKEYLFEVLRKGEYLYEDEGIAFSIATLITNQNDVLFDKLIVATEKNAFENLVEHYNNLIIITNI